MSHTYKDVKEWADRMEENLLKRNKDYSKIVNRLTRYCPYKMTNFCDGRPNVSGAAKGQRSKKKPQCIYYIDGRCTNKKIRLGIEVLDKNSN